MLANKPFLRQEDVQKILDAANAHAEKHDWAVTIAVCDDGGHLLGLIRRDGCAPVSSYIAQDRHALQQWVSVRAKSMKILLITAEQRLLPCLISKECSRVESILMWMGTRLERLVYQVLNLQMMLALHEQELLLFFNYHFNLSDVQAL